ncbi:MAG TPA: rhodanese-like domain-containing protein [Vicinamibacterales bacterium]|nr:rhodanese-like domain-containing protein [Vicinamibacterales bacterium]
MRRRVSLLFVAAVFAATPAAAQTRAGSVPLLLSTAWLEEHLQESDVVVLYTDQGAHDEALIAGARAVPHESLMTMQGGHGLASTDVLVEALRKAGVSNDSHVVVYGEPLSVGWLFFVLEYLGHPRVSVLDASITKWRAENRPFARTPVAPPRGTFTPSPRPQLRATADDVRAQAAGGGGAVLDARSAREYEAGHIPGARLLTWQDVFVDPRQQVFKSRDELVAMFRAAGAAPGATAVTYCQIGLRSSALYFAARLAGLDARNYVGSWSDWTARGLPVEPGR